MDKGMTNPTTTPTTPELAEQLKQYSMWRANLTLLRAEAVRRLDVLTTERTDLHRRLDALGDESRLLSEALSDDAPVVAPQPATRTGTTLAREAVAILQAQRGEWINGTHLMMKLGLDVNPSRVMGTLFKAGIVERCGQMRGTKYRVAA
jgi:hypothetical protein